MRKPDQSSNAGNPEGAAHRGRFFFGYFLFGEAKESNLLSGNPRRCLVSNAMFTQQEFKESCHQFHTEYVAAKKGISTIERLGPYLTLHGIFSDPGLIQRWVNGRSFLRKAT